jgi:predicted nuclease of restriction endonuclease-like (RecB) superfamily
MRAFYLAYADIVQTPSGQSPLPPQDAVAQLHTNALELRRSSFPLPWSHYVRLLAIDNPEARRFYEEEALRGGWSVRQLRRQIASQFYERTLLSRNKAAMLTRGRRPRPEDRVTPEEEIKDPFVLEFLDLQDEYSESDLEEALIRQLERFLLELGGDFAFIGRQRRLRVGQTWYRVDLVFFHRRLRCLVLIDLKLDAFSPADVGQMNLYVNYARALSSAKIRFTSSSWPVKALDRAICRRIVLNLSLTDPYHFTQALILGPEGAQRKETAHKSRYFQRTSMRHRYTDDTESSLWLHPLPEISDESVTQILIKRYLAMPRRSPGC